MYRYIYILLNKFILYTFNYLHSSLSNVPLRRPSILHYYRLYTEIKDFSGNFHREIRFTDELQHRSVDRKSRTASSKVPAR